MAGFRFWVGVGVAGFRVWDKGVGGDRQRLASRVGSGSDLGVLGLEKGWGVGGCVLTCAPSRRPPPPAAVRRLSTPPAGRTNAEGRRAGDYSEEEPLQATTGESRAAQRRDKRNSISMNCGHHFSNLERWQLCLQRSSSGMLHNLFPKGPPSHSSCFPTSGQPGIVVMAYDDNHGN
ncbi:hypothetical protein DM860_012238 [Cuscuta australis]|uniref:Uncharacterized protein n=1 Tax=Cuscuta australis TaxID=267555 RepID=A0A328EAM9_9ASTE|nr:hypothetical protein DM860_012238 [Cuscuta australis]